MDTPHQTKRLGIGGQGIALLTAVAMFVGACATSGTSAAPGGALTIVTTTTVFADIVKNVGGDRVSVHSIIPAGVGPEDYEPKPDDAKSLSGASLIVSNGVGLDDFVQKLLAASGDAGSARLVLGDGIPTIDVDGTPNPHFWLDPSLVATYYVPAISAKLTALDPAGASTFQANATSYTATLAALDGDLKAQIAQLPPSNRKLVTFHDAFPYFARHFGFELIGVILANPGQEPSAGDLARLVDIVKAAGVKAVFSESQSNPSLAQTLAQEAGVTNVVTSLYNDALGPSPADTYQGMMRWNVSQIVQALR